jgi:hypothetical protein
MLGGTVQSGLGVSEEPRRALCIVRTAVAGATLSKGTPVQLDFARTYATNARFGDPDSCFSIVRLPTALGQQGVGVLGVLEADTDDKQRGMVKFGGMARALIRKASGDVSPGDPLVAKNGQAYLSADFSPGDRVVATYQGASALSAPSTATLGDVLFEGESGYGIDVA